MKRINNSSYRIAYLSLSTFPLRMSRALLFLVGITFSVCTAKGQTIAWQFSYQASSNMLPTAATPSWTVSGAYAPLTLSGKDNTAVLNFPEGEPYMNKPFNSGAPAYDPTQLASTIEFAMAVTNPGTFTGEEMFSQTLYFDTAVTGTKSQQGIGVVLGIGSSVSGLNTLTLQASNGEMPTSVTSTEARNFDLSQMTVYRLTILTTGSGDTLNTEVDLYINNQTTPVLRDTITRPQSSFPANPLQLDGTGKMSSTSTASLSYIQWTNAGAFPVTSP